LLFCRNIAKVICSAAFLLPIFASIWLTVCLWMCNTSIHLSYYVVLARQDKGPPRQKYNI